MSTNASSGPEAVDGVSHFGIQVADFERSVSFYGDALGLELVTRWTRSEPYIQELVGYPGVELHVAVFRLPHSETFLEVLEYRNVHRQQIDPGTANPGTAHLCLYVTDLDALHARLVASGTRFMSPVKSPTVGPNRGGKVVYMLDPDGIRVELLETTKTLAGDTRA